MYFSDYSHSHYDIFYPKSKSPLARSLTYDLCRSEQLTSTLRQYECLTSSLLSSGPTASAWLRLGSELQHQVFGGNQVGNFSASSDGDGDMSSVVANCRSESKAAMELRGRTQRSPEKLRLRRAFLRVSGLVGAEALL